MTRSKEKWQAHMNRVGGSMLRNETAELSQHFAQFGARQKGVGRWTVEDDRKWGGSISWDSPSVMRGRDSVDYTIEHDAANNSFLVYRDAVFLGESESLGEAKAKAKADLNYRTPEFGAMASPNWTPGAHLEEALTEANPNVYNFTYGTQNTARFGAPVTELAWYGKGKLSGWRIYRKKGGLTIVPSAAGLRETTGHIAHESRALPYARAPKAVRAVYDKLKRQSRG